MKRSFVKTSGTAALLGALLVGALWPGAAAGKATGAASYNIGFESFEPTLGATASGDLYFSTTPAPGVLAGWRASIAKSTDRGRTWKDVGPTLPTGHSNPPETNDPYIYVDPGTNRIFTFHMSPILLCSVMSFSDDGGKTWQTNPKGCSPTLIWDHQTLVAAKPRTVTTKGYPNVLHQCVNAVYAAMCARSLDGGLTWEASVPAYPKPEPTKTCGAQHGHLTAAPNGTVYLPTSLCGTRPTVFISDDDGMSWRESRIADMDTPFVDPTVSVDAKGNLYAAFIDESGWLYFSTSGNKGKTWSKAARVAEGFTTNMPVIVAGDPGKVVIAYPATDDLNKGYETDNYTRGNQAALKETVSWGANLTVSHNALARKPKFETTVVTGNDPIGRGYICEAATRCEFLVDFIEAVIGPDGRPYASFVDGCLASCAKSPSGEQDFNSTGVGLLATLQGGPRLCASTCWRYKQAAQAQMDQLEAWGFALSPAQREASRQHATLSPHLKALQRQATQRRLRAVSRSGT